MDVVEALSRLGDEMPQQRLGAASQESLVLKRVLLKNKFPEQWLNINVLLLYYNITHRLQLPLWHY